MLNTRLPAMLALQLAVLSPVPAAADETAGDEPITEITVSARRVANLRPAGTYASPATTLRFDPLTELQSRGLAEGQSDVTVRGGVFENTGFKLGAMAIMDPQTGHYTAELPVDPAFLTAPAIYQGVDGAVQGFNAAVATVAYSVDRIARGGAVTAGVGGDSLDYQTLRFGYELQSGIALAFSAARSSGDGTRPYGDHEFARYNLLVQHLGDATRTDFVIGYQDKFFGWPGAYTGFASLPETDDTQTILLAFNQRRESGNGWFEYGAFFRQLEDDYDFNRLDFETGVPGSYEHETRVVAVGFQGLQRGGGIDWRYGGQLTRDELVRSTDLTNGRFTDRSYVTLTVVPSLSRVLAGDSVLTWRAGLTFDYSDRDGSEVLPLVGVTLSSEDASGTTAWTLEYAATSQLPGYTALSSGPTGLFGGNPGLSRETARQLSASVTRDTDAWQMRATVFGRQDRDLVDWTYAGDAPFARQANPVDLDVIGVEAFVTRQWQSLDLAAGYTWLDKDADYGTASVDASFYALNFARHRATLGMRYRFAGEFEFRLDNEYRSQEKNPLRAGDDNTFLASLSLHWNSATREGLSAALVVDNLTDSEFQTFPGTPAYGRQYSINATWHW